MSCSSTGFQNLLILKPLLSNKTLQESPRHKQLVLEDSRVSSALITWSCSLVYCLWSAHTGLHSHCSSWLLYISSHLILSTTVVIPNLRTCRGVRHVILHGETPTTLASQNRKSKESGQGWCSCSETRGLFYSFPKPSEGGFSPSGC